MNYEESKKIKEAIDASNNFLINCHLGVDTDSIASALSFKKLLESLGKKVDIFCPEKLPETLKFLPGSEKIGQKNFSDINYSDYDSFFMLDSETWNRVGLSSYSGSAKVINIDHHPQNNIKGVINVLDENAFACCEMIYLIFKDFGVEMDSSLSTILLAGILSDTNFFQNFTSSRALSLASELVNNGADHNFLSFNMYRKNKPDTLKAWGALLDSMKIDYDHKFAWFSLPYEEYSKFNVGGSPTSEVSDLFAKTIEGTNFGIVMVEKEKNKLLVSLRSREDWFDVSRIAHEFGGGGHRLSSGGAIKDMAYTDAVKTVLDAAVKHYDQKI